MCAKCHRQNECVVCVIVWVVLGFQTAKGATDMPTGCEVWRLPSRRSASERSGEKDRDILKWEAHAISLSLPLFHTLSVFSATRQPIAWISSRLQLAALNPPCVCSWFGKAGLAAFRWQQIQTLISWQQRYEYSNRHWSDCIGISQQNSSDEHELIINLSTEMKPDKALIEASEKFIE